MMGLEYIVKEFELKYTEIAEFLNISKKTVSHWITGRRNVTEKHRKLLATYFGIPPSYFTKELNSIEKIEVQRARVKFLEKLKMEVLEQPIEDHHLSEELQREKIAHDLREHMDEDMSLVSKLELLADINILLKEDDEKKIEYLATVIKLLKHTNDWGGDPYTHSPNEKLAKSLNDIFEKHLQN